MANIHCQGMSLIARSRLSTPAMGSISGPPILDRSAVEAAHERIKQHIHYTPVLTSTKLSDLASTARSPEALAGTPWEGQTPARPKIRLFFKCENYQRIGAFKSRGAFHALSRLTPEQLVKGVVTHSSGISYCRLLPTPIGESSADPRIVSWQAIMRKRWRSQLAHTA